MSAKQLLLIIGITYIAPHLPKTISIFLGLVFLLGASVVGLIGGAA